MNLNQVRFDTSVLKQYSTVLYCSEFVRLLSTYACILPLVIFCMNTSIDKTPMMTNQLIFSPKSHEMK